MPPRKTTRPSGSAKRSPASKKRAPSKPRTRKKSASGTLASKRRQHKPAASRPSSWKRWLFFELATVGTGVALGLAVAGGFLWKRAGKDVDAYLASPPRTVPGVIWSAPIELRAGMRLSGRHLAADLLAAGYERVDSLDGPQQFAVSGGRFQIWTAADAAHGVKGGKTTVVLSKSRILQTQPKRVQLAPTVLGTIGDPADRRTDVELKALSKWMEPALLSMEDARFREHAGVDPFGIARAVAHNLSGRTGMHGGSTLTQQLAKNLFLSPERSLKRKVREAFFAAALEDKLSKDQLLELYLGEVYLGQAGGVPLHGVDRAARAWFGVSASRVSLSQAATIAGVISAPNRYSPLRHPERARERRDLVLDRMVTTGAISADVAEKTKATELVVRADLGGAVRRAPWAVDAAVDAAEREVGAGALAAAGHQVHTTIQPALQHAAVAAVRQGLAELDKDYPKAAGAEAALVAVRVEDGAVVALVGGRSYVKSPFNRATQAWRQAGSTVKPLTLLAAMNKDASVSPVTRIHDEPITLSLDGRPWSPRNYDGKFTGEISVRRTIESSRNIPAILLAEDVGWTEVQHFYREAGLSRASNLPSTALGAFAATPLELAGAYTVFPGGGDVREPYVVTQIDTADGKLMRRTTPRKKSLANARAAAMATSVLQGVVTDGTGARAARYGVKGAVGGKTGTTNGYRDAWFVGFTPELAVAVWVGRDRGTLGLAGSRAALPTWSRFVEGSGTMNGFLPQPEGIERVMICTESGLPARNACPAAYQETLSTEAIPNHKCDVHGGPVIEMGRVFGLFGRGGDDE